MEKVKENGTEKELLNKVAKEVLDKDFITNLVKEILSKIPITVEITTTGVERYEKELKRLRSQENKITELIQCYLDAIKEVKEGNLSPKEKLKKLLPPLISLHNIYFPNYLAHHEFIEDCNIDFNNEIDSKNLTYDKGKYTIHGPIIKVDDSAIWEHGRISISDEYRLYLHFCRDVKNISEYEFKKLVEDGTIYIENDPVNRIHLGNQDWKYNGTKKVWIDKTV